MVTRQMDALKEMEKLLNKRQKKLEERETEIQNTLSCNNYRKIDDKVSHDERKVSSTV